MNVFDTLVFLKLPKVGRKTVKKIIDLNISESINQVDAYINVVSKISSKVASTIDKDHVEKAIEYANEIIDLHEKKDIIPICFEDERYPELLRHLGNDAPVLLFVIGDIESLKMNNKVAIIGTRNNSQHGLVAGSVITKHFVKKDYTIVSGLAKGCDTIAHKACLQTKGKTIAVMAGGLDTVYPKENKQLAKEIISNGGCLVSEYPVMTQIRNNNFVERDRIQSGLSKAVVVIETDTKGGTLYTVEYAQHQQRPIACIKYNDNIQIPSNAGNRMLISQNIAFPLTSQNIDTFICEHIERNLTFTTEKEVKENIQNKKTNALKVVERTKSTIRQEKKEIENKVNKNLRRIDEIRQEVDSLERKSLEDTSKNNNQLNIPYREYIHESSFIIQLKNKIELLNTEKKKLITENKQLLNTKNP